MTITGANDGPQVSTGTTAGTITELSSVSGSNTLDTAFGTLGFTDADLSDTHGASILSVTAGGVTSGLPANATMLGWLATGVLTEQAGATPGSLPWTFTAPDSTFDYLGAGQSATLTYVVRTTDSQGANLDQSVTITITGSNDTPNANDVTDTVVAGATATGTVAASDVDGDTLSYTLGTAPTHGSATVDAATGAFSYTPTTGFSGSDAFTVQIADGQGGVTNANVSFTVTSGTNFIYGTSAGETLTGTAGNDVIFGYAGNDAINGGDGDDEVRVSGNGEGFDAIDGGAGSDTIVALADNTVIGLTSIANVEAISANGFSGVGILGTAAADTFDFSNVTLTGLDEIGTADGNDTVIGSAAADSIFGGNGVDTLSGGDGDDYLGGNAGNDTLSGNAGNDTFAIYGTGNGFDAIDGGIGTDSILAFGNNTRIGLTSIANVETISANGYSGVYISGTGGAETFDFSSTTLTSIVRVQGGAGNDVITGSTGDDIILGENGNDTLNGGDGNDRLTGGANNDILNGGNGDDTLIGSAQADTLTGGAGADHFLFDSLTTSADKDTIADFVSGTDLIEIDRAVFVAFSGDPAGTLSSSSFFSGSQAQTVDQHLIYNAGALYYDADGSGAGAQIQIATLTGAPGLTTADFLLI